MQRKYSFQIIVPLTYYIIFKAKKSLSLTQVFLPAHFSNWMLSIILIMLIYYLV